MTNFNETTPLIQPYHATSEPVDQSICVPEVDRGVKARVLPFEQSPTTRSVSLVAVIWISMILFGSFALFQYILPALVWGDWERWERTDAGLYRPTHTVANLLMVIHMCFGIFLQIAGPIQLIPYMRRKHLRFHRWVGRVYIASALLLASGCATIYVWVYRTSRRWIHEDIGNVIFGGSVFISAAMSLYHILNGRVEAHKVWSVRLFLAVFGATLVRVLAVPYFVGIAVGLSARQWVLNLLFYTIVIPSWVGYEVIRTTTTKKYMGCLQVGGAIGLGFMTLIIFAFAWLPSMLGRPSVQSSISDHFNDDFPKL